MTEFGKLLKKYRLRNLMTLKQMKELTGLAESHLCRLESGQTKKVREITIARVVSRVPELAMKEE